MRNNKDDKLVLEVKIDYNNKQLSKKKKLYIYKLNQFECPS